MAYFIFIIIEESNFVLSVSAVPRTFGIRYGSSVLTLVLCSRIYTLILASLPIAPGPMLAVILSANIVALVICFFFKEELDIGRMVDRGKITFRNFGFQKE